MPFLRLYAPSLPLEMKQRIARELTDGIIRAWHLPLTARDATTIRFVPVAPEDVAVGGMLVSDGATMDVTLEITDRDLTRARRDALNRELTPRLIALLDLADTPERVNLIFQVVGPHEMAVGGRFFDESEMGY